MIDTDSTVNKSKLIPLKNTSIHNYLHMLNDGKRNKFYYDALQKHAKDKVVLDMGTGTGILAYYALLFGAKFVYCFERNPDISQVAQSVLEKKFSKDRFKVVVANFWNTNLNEIFDHNIDILLSETVGPGLFDQGMINTWHCVKPYLTKNAISIPDRLHCDLWIYENFQIEEIKKGPTVGPLKGPTPRLYAPAINDDDFVNFLLQADQETTAVTVTPWQEVNRMESLPSKKFFDVVSYTLNNQPVMTFIDQAEVGNIKSNIDFEVDILQNSIVLIINKISFENETMYLKDAPYSGWKMAPKLKISTPGRYKFSWQNHNFEHFCGHEWKYDLVA